MLQLTHARIRPFALLVVAALLMAVLPPGGARATEHEGYQPDVTVRVNENHSGRPGPSHSPVVTADGGSVVWVESMLALDGQWRDQLWKGGEAGTGRLVFPNSGAVDVHGDMRLPAVTAEGEFVAYVTDAADLLPDGLSDDNDRPDVYVSPLHYANVEHFRVSVGLDGQQLAQGVEWDQPAIVYVRTAEGMALLVAFTTTQQIVAEDTNEHPDVYLSIFDVVDNGWSPWDVTFRSVHLVSGVLAEDGEPGTTGPGRSGQPALSPDGRWLALVSENDLRDVEGSPVEHPQVFLRTLWGEDDEGQLLIEPGVPMLVSSPDGDAPGDGPSAAPRVSAPAGGPGVPFVAFQSEAAGLADYGDIGVPVARAGDEGGHYPEVYRWWSDGDSRRVDWVSARRSDADFVRGRGADSPDISHSGRFVSFASDAFLPDDEPETATGNVYRRDMDPEGHGLRREPAQAAREAHLPDDEGFLYDSGSTSITGNGRHVVFLHSRMLEWGAGDIEGPYTSIEDWQVGHGVAPEEPEPATITADLVPASPTVGTTAALHIDFVDPSGTEDSSYAYRIYQSPLDPFGWQTTDGEFEELAAGDPEGMAGSATGSITYSSAGQHYTAVMLLKDGEAVVTSDLLTVTVTAPSAALSVGTATVTALSGDPEEPILQGEPAVVTFPFSDTEDRSPYTAEICWDDGTDSCMEGLSPDEETGETFTSQYVYLRRGTYDVVATVTADDGTTAQGVASVEVANVAPSDLQIGYEGEDLDVQLYASWLDPGRDDPFAITIDWGDGTTSGLDADDVYAVPGRLAVSAGHTYAASGRYTVTVSVDDGDADLDPLAGSENIRVGRQLTALLDTTGAVYAGQSKSFAWSMADWANGNPYQLRIDWRELESGTIPITASFDGVDTWYASGTLSHTFPDPGEYEVLLTITAADGLVATTTLPVTVLAPADLSSTIALEVQAPPALDEPSSMPAALPGIPAAVSITAGSKAVPIADIPPEAILGPPPADGVVAAPLRAIDVSATPLRAIEIADTPLRAIPLRAIPLRAIPLRAIPLRAIPLRAIDATTPATTWEELLVGTRLEGVPLTVLTLEDVANLQPSPLDALHLGEVNLAATPLRAISVTSIVLGATPLRAIPLRAIDADGNETQLDWCDVLADLGFPCGIDGIGPDSTLIALEIAGVPLRAIPLRAIPLRAIDIADTPLRAIPLRAINVAVTPLRAIPLRAIGNLDDIVDCQAFDCTDPEATFGQAHAAGAVREGVTLVDLYDAIPETVMLAEILLGLIPLEDYPWEQLALDELGVQDFAPAHTPPLRFAAWFEITSTDDWQPDTPMATLEVDLPAGFRYAGNPRYVTAFGNYGLHHTEIRVVDGTLTVELPEVYVDEGPMRFAFDVHPSLSVGEFTPTARLTVEDAEVTEAEEVTQITVTEHFEEPGQDPEDVSTLPQLEPDVLYLSHIAEAGDVDYFAVPAPPAGQRLSVSLTNLGGDGDLVLYSPVEAAPLRAIPLRAIPLRAISPPDAGAGVDAAQTSLEPETLRDIPLRAIPLRAISANRGTEDEEVEVVSQSSDVGKHFIVQVTGYNGSTSDEPYIVRVRHKPAPPPQSCTTGISPAGAHGTAPSAADLADADTLFALNVERIRGVHGQAGLDEIISALDDLITAQARLGITAAVVPVDAYGAVRDAYREWDAQGCDPDMANAVVDAINAELLTLRGDHPTISSIVLIGGDDLLPMARLIDVTRLANQRDYASGVGTDNPVSAAFATEHILSDNPYGSSTSLQVLDRRLYVPDVAVGRLVESPSDIAAQLGLFVTSGGHLDPQTALTTGYDFLTDGAEAVDDALGRRIGSQQRGQLIDEEWSREDLSAALFPVSGDSPDVASVNAHFDHHRALPADEHAKHSESNLFTVSDIEPGRLEGRLLFSMGCHAGLAVPDAWMPDGLKADWPQALAVERAMYVANTGFGYGDTETVALSERLMELFAANLDGTMTVGAALSSAKQTYSGEMGIYGPYDEKIVQESTLFGLPMYRIGSADPDSGDEPEAQGTTMFSFGFMASMASPDGTVLDPVTGLPVAPAGYASTPTSPLLSRLGDRGRFWTVGEELPQVTHWRPIQPRTVREVTVDGLDARGALITGLTSMDVAGVDAVFARPTVDLAANEPEVEFGGVAFPAQLTHLTRTEHPAGPRDQLVIMPGQFVSDLASGDTTGTQRLYTRVQALVHYGEPGSADTTPPTFTSSQAVADSDAVQFTVEVDDDGGDVKRVLVLFRDMTPGGVWKSVDLSPTGAGRWSGIAAAQIGDPLEPRIEWFVQAVDAAGNVGVSSNKGEMFPAEPFDHPDPDNPDPDPIPAPGALGEPGFSGELGDSGWYLGAVTLSVPPGHTATVDGQPASDGDAIVGEGLRTVVVSRDGRSTTHLVAIDTGDPDVVVSAPRATVDQGDAATAGFTCADATSGVASCTAVVGPVGGDKLVVADGAALDTSTPGDFHLVVTGVDRAGRRTVVTHAFTVGAPPPPDPTYSFAGFRPPVDGTKENVARAGSTIPVRWAVTWDDDGSSNADLVPATIITWSKVDCVGGTGDANQVDQTVVTTNNNTVTYSATDGVYQVNWKTDKKFARGCYVFTVYVDEDLEDPYDAWRVLGQAQFRFT